MPFPKVKLKLLRPIFESGLPISFPTTIAVSLSAPADEYRWIRSLAEDHSVETVLMDISQLFYNNEIYKGKLIINFSFLKKHITPKVEIINDLSRN